MTDSRLAIPAALERELMIEAGYRCSICKATETLNIEHIVEWVDVQKHEFQNMIFICANCHGRKKNNSDPRNINRTSLKKIKSNLMLLNGRYSDLERRIIDGFQEVVKAQPESNPFIIIPERLRLLVAYIIKDNLVLEMKIESPVTIIAPDGTKLKDDYLKLTLTAHGRAFIENLNTVQ